MKQSWGSPQTEGFVKQVDFKPGIKHVSVMGDENGELTEKKETEWLSASVTIYESAVAPNTFFASSTLSNMSEYHHPSKTVWLKGAF